MVATATGELVQRKPVIYQDIDGTRVPVDGRYQLQGARVSFEVAAYDRSHTLVIDPLPAFNLYAPGVHREIANAIAVGADGSAYIAGYSTPYDYARRVRVLSDDVFVTKLNPSGTAIEYATYVGGASTDLANAIAVDASGAVHVAGDTFSNDFPVVNAAQPSRAGFREGFALKLTPNGRKLVYSTCLGGVADDTATARAANGELVVGGVSSSLAFPMVDALQPANAGRADGFVTRFAAVGSILRSTYLGSSDDDGINSVAVDAASDAVLVTGFTESFGLGTVGAFQSARTPNLVTPDNPNTSFDDSRVNSYADAFVARLDRASNSLGYVSDLGGDSEDTATGIAADAAGGAWVTGCTGSIAMPTRNPLQRANSGADDVFVFGLTPAGTALSDASYRGAPGRDYANGIALDGDGDGDGIILAGTEVLFPTRVACGADQQPPG